MSLVRVLPSAEDEVNAAAFHPHPVSNPPVFQPCLVSCHATLILRVPHMHCTPFLKYGYDLQFDPVLILVITIACMSLSFNEYATAILHQP